MKSTRKLLVSVALSGLYAGLTGTANARPLQPEILPSSTSQNRPSNDPDSNDTQTLPQDQHKPRSKKEKHACKGQNSCKGKGGCGATKGKNDCKGKGECRSDGKPMEKEK